DAPAALDDGDLDHAVADGLLRQVRLGEEVAAQAVIRAHFGGGVVQALEVELLADELLHLLAQLVLGDERIAGEGEGRDLDAQLRLRAKRGLRLGRAWREIRRRRRQAKRLARLLQDAPGVGTIGRQRLLERDD